MHVIRLLVVGLAKVLISISVYGHGKKISIRLWKDRCAYFFALQ